MGKAWFDASPEARAVFEEADRVLGDELGAPLSTLCFDGPADQLNKTSVCQPALYTSAVASFRALCSAWGFAEGEAPIACAAGLSLGEYTALHLAGAFSFEDGLRLVTLRGRAMQDAADASDSGMVALIGADEAQANEVCDAAREGGVLVCANFNAPGQIVISGDSAACDRAEGVASDKGLRATRLQVAGAFHSPIMQPAAERLGEALASTDISAPRCPVYSNVTAEPHRNDAESIRTRLTEQLTSSVRWSDSFASIAGAYPEAALHELAPGKTLAGLARRIERSAKVTPHDAP